MYYNLEIRILIPKIFQIMDATNTTRARRDLILDKCEPEGIRVMFVESVLEDEMIEEMNIRVNLELIPNFRLRRNFGLSSSSRSK